jgi:hypothetical protein
MEAVLRLRGPGGADHVAASRSCDTRTRARTDALPVTIDCAPTGHVAIRGSAVPGACEAPLPDSVCRVVFVLFEVDSAAVAVQPGAQREGK